MAEEHPYTTGTIKPVKPNRVGKWMADALRKAHGGMNELLHHESGFGLGDLVLGEAPRLMDDIAHGDPGIRRTGHGYNLDPAYMDLAGVAAVPAAAVTKTATGTSKAMQKALRNAHYANKAEALFEPDPMRRKILKAGATGAGILTAPTLMTKALKEGATEGAAAAAKTGTGVVAKTGMSAGVKAALKDILANEIGRVFVKNYAAGTRLELANPEIVAKHFNNQAMDTIRKKANYMVDRHGDNFDLEGYIKRTDYSPDMPGDEDLGLRSWKGESWDNPATKHLEKLKTHEARELVEDWQATGKWPDDIKDKMQYFDRQQWVESNVDQMAGGMYDEEDLVDAFSDLLHDHYDPKRYGRPAEDMDLFDMETPWGKHPADEFFMKK